MPGRRRFGSLRKLPSGRWQARYTAPDGREHKAPTTFDTKGDADRWLAVEDAKIQRGEWKPPAAAHAEQVKKVAQTFASYADEVMDRRKLRATTRDLYAKLLKRINDTFGDSRLNAITPQEVHRWYISLASTPTTQANAYSLFRSILADAVADELIERNPCKVRGGSTKTRAKEPLALTGPELAAYLAAVPDRYKVPLLLAGWGGLRSGEVRGLRRRDLDLTAGVVRVEQQAVKVDGRWVVTRPKTAAGVRVVALPPSLLDGLRTWLKKQPVRGTDGLLFTNRAGDAPMAESTLWEGHTIGRDAIGKPDLTIHALRHTNLTLLAESGATVAELMAHAGHSTPSMALRYQHAQQQREMELAGRLDRLAQEPLVTIW